MPEHLSITVAIKLSIFLKPYPILTVSFILLFIASILAFERPCLDLTPSGRHKNKRGI
jgi:hypothetical protein